MSSGKTLATVAILAASFLVGAADLAETVSTPSLESILQGRAVYQKHCVVCHGQAGDGRGEMASTLKPRPRDFHAGHFKFRSTPSGTLPTDDDLARTIRGGLAGTAMPIFSNLREREVRAVIAYVKSLSPRWQKAENYAAPLPLPKRPAWFEQLAQLTRRAARGKELFTTACAPCHGPQGDGRGSAASELTDSTGQLIAPSDLHKPLRCGTTSRDLYRVLVTGLDGTPMPSFLGALSEEQLWEVIAYVIELRGKESGGDK